MRKVQQQPLASTSNNNYQFSQQFVQQYPNYYRAQPSQFISNSFYTQPTNNSGPVYNMPASQQYYSNPSMISYGNPTSRFSPSKIQKPKKTSPIMNRYLSPKLLANSGVMKNVYQPSSQQTSIPTVIYANNNAVQYSNSQPQQQTHVKQTYRGGVKSSTSIPSINTVQQNRNYSNPQPMTATHSNQPQTQIYQHRYPTNSNQNMTTAQQQPMHINQHKNYAATTKPLMRQQQTVTRNPQTSNSSMYSNTNNTTSNNDQVHKHYHHHYPSNTSERTIMHHVLNSNNTSVNSSISSVGSAYSNVSRLSANTSILSNMSDVSEHDYMSEQRQMPQTSGSILDPRTRSWNSFTPSSAANQPTNTTEKKSEVVERKPAKALEPTMVEHDDQDSTYKTLSQNRSAAWMWSPTKIQRAQERTKRQIMSVLLSPSSSEDDEDEEIFAKIQQRYNEATIRINSIINSTAPPTTNNKLDACMQTDESIFQNTRSAPKKAPQLSDSHDSDSVRSRPTAFKSQTLTTSFQQQKDKIDSFYLPPIVFPSSLSEDMDFNIDSIRKSSQKQESNHSLSSSSSSEGVMFSPINNTSTKVQPISIASGNNRYIVDSMINSVLEEDLKEDEDMVLYDDFDSEESTSSIGFGDCSLSSFGSPCSVGKIDLSTSLEGVLSNSDEMRRMVEKEIFLSKNKPKDRIKFSEDSVEITSFRQSRQISTVSLVSHCINQIFLNGSPETTLFLERMITIVCDRADIDFRCALSALFFMVKLQNPTFITDENNYNLINEFQRKSAFGNIEPSNFIYTFFVTLMISSKINEDNYYNNKTFFKYMAVNEFKQIFHAFNLDNAFNYMNDMELLMVKEDGSVPVQQTLSCSERVHSQTLANERYKKYFQQFNITEVNITMALKYDVCVKEESLCNFLDKLERVNESLLIC